MNYNRDLVNLVGKLKEVISHCLCCGEVKDQTVTCKLNECVKELEQCSVAKGLICYCLLLLTLLLP